MSGIVIAIITVGGVGLLISVFLSIFGNIFKVEVDERQTAVEEALPGNNCGGCGYAGCANLAEAIVKGEAPVNACPVGGANVAAKVAEIMGTDAGDSAKKVAYVRCSGRCDVAKTDYEYHGLDDCVMASSVPGQGDKSCNYGCLGLGSCVKACKFGAISIIDGIAYVDKEKCTSCGMCVNTCPRHIIELVPYEPSYIVTCNSNDRGVDVGKACKAGCIGCGICAKNCPTGAVTVTNNLAHVDYEKCTGCGTCAEKCPKKVILHA